jgi:hypothetical protein
MKVSKVRKRVFAFLLQSNETVTPGSATEYPTVRANSIIMKNLKQI